MGDCGSFVLYPQYLESRSVRLMVGWIGGWMSGSVGGWIGDGWMGEWMDEKVEGGVSPPFAHGLTAPQTTLP